MDDSEWGVWPFDGDSMFVFELCGAFCTAEEVCSNMILASVSEMKVSEKITSYYPC